MEKNLKQSWLRRLMVIVLILFYTISISKMPNAKIATKEYTFTDENTYKPYSDYSQPEYDQSRDRKENMEVNPNAKSLNKDCDTENRRSEKYNSKTGRLEYRACYTTSAKKVKSEERWYK